MDTCACFRKARVICGRATPKSGAHAKYYLLPVVRRSDRKICSLAILPFSRARRGKPRPRQVETGEPNGLTSQNPCRRRKTNPRRLMNIWRTCGAHAKYYLLPVVRRSDHGKKVIFCM